MPKKDCCEFGGLTTVKPPVQISVILLNKHGAKPAITLRDRE